MNIPKDGMRQHVFIWKKSGNVSYARVLCCQESLVNRIKNPLLLTQTSPAPS